MQRIHIFSPLLIATYLIVALAIVVAPGSGFFFPGRGFLAATSPTTTTTTTTTAAKPTPPVARMMRPSKRSFFARLTPLRGGGGGATKGGAAAARALFDNAPFWQSQKLLLGINALGYVLTIATKSHYHVDLLGTGAFAVAAVVPLFAGQLSGGSGGASTAAAAVLRSLPRVQWSATIVAAWSVKLALFLFYRVLQSGHDSRLDDILDSPYYAAGFWTYSWIWGALASLPHTIGLSSTLPGSPLWLKVGTVVAVSGWTMETLADYQKWSFKLTHPGQFCNAGVWSVSQHPNWFGNLLLWSGVVVMNASALIDPTSSSASSSSSSSSTLLQHWSQQVWRFRRLGLALLSPAFMWYLFNSQATGQLLPEAVQAYKDRYQYGKDPKFTHYVDTTPLIVPRLSGILGATLGANRMSPNKTE